MLVPLGVSHLCKRFQPIFGNNFQPFLRNGRSQSLVMPITGSGCGFDFCHKYCHRYADRESLKHFMLKLHEKHQSLAMQEEAAKAATLYYEMHLN